MYGVMRKSCSIAGRSLKYIWKYGVGFNDTVNHLNAYVCPKCNKCIDKKWCLNFRTTFVLVVVILRLTEKNQTHFICTYWIPF